MNFTRMRAEIAQAFEERQNSINENVVAGKWTTEIAAIAVDATTLSIQVCDTTPDAELLTVLCIVHPDDVRKGFFKLCGKLAGELQGELAGMRETA